MAAKVGPTIRRIQLGQELRRLRDQANLTLADASEGMGFDKTRLSKVENGVARLRSSGQLRDLLERYGVETEEDVQFLLDVHSDSLSQEWWSPFRSVMPSGMALYVGLEAGARTMRAYNQDAVHGLMQSESYARALFDAAKPVEEHTTPYIESQIELRMGRADVLTRENPLELEAIVDEAVLRRVVGTPETMCEQYDRLLELSKLDHVTIQILPLRASGPIYRSLGNFSLLEFDPPVPEVVQVDGFGAVSIVDKKIEVWKYSRRFNAMRAGALPRSETPTHLHRLAREMKQLSTLT